MTTGGEALRQHFVYLNRLIIKMARVSGDYFFEGLRFTRSVLFGVLAISACTARVSEHIVAPNAVQSTFESRAPCIWEIRP